MRLPLIRTIRANEARPGANHVITALKSCQENAGILRSFARWSEVAMTRKNLPALTRRSVMDPTDLLTEQELADYLKVSLSSARRMRYDKTGPPVVWVGRHPRYLRADVHAWV